MNTTEQGVLHPPVNPDDHAMGREDAPITLVEYGDFQCPYCYAAHPIVMRLQKRFGAQLRFIFRNFPLSELHPHAAHAAEAAESVAAHAGETAYWRMHNAIYEHQQDSADALDDEHLAHYAADAGADASVVRTDLESGTHRPRVRSDFVSGVRSGVNGTPTFFINGVRFEGDWTQVKEFSAALEDAAPARQHSTAQR
jgi:protein-disulfide isomerase